MSQHTCNCACTVVDGKLIEICGPHAQNVRKNVDDYAQQKMNAVIGEIRDIIGAPGQLLIAPRDELLRKIGNVLLSLDASQP